MIALGATAAHAAKTVLVGGYPFPPYVDLAPDNTPTGLTIDLIDVLNRQQDQYDFRFFLTAPTRRYQDFQAGLFDVVLFEMPEWGWSAHGIDVDVSREIATDGEVYVAHTAKGRDESYFDDVGSHRVAGILGYNYGFTGFHNDPDELRRRFDIALVNDHTATIALVLRGRADIGVVTESFLRRYLAAHPQDRAGLLVSKRHDQVYSLRVLTRPGTRPSADDIAGLIEQADRAGSLTPLWQRYGLAR